ncbi:unnamed protein product [Phytophthora fragariaefolia]|uniref:Unnamed protein product n=1 Tax=Phytophthora fragariaefolia TaxID=1490495 RepID=A0A9W6Y4C8_9STRA|nr:unnamed protein product [Phytophthora fragariaefolia]
MDDWVDPKAFKKLWSQLLKGGWKARAPSGLDVDQAYVMPGVTGRLRMDRRNVDYFIGMSLEVPIPNPIYLVLMRYRAQRAVEIRKPGGAPFSTSPPRLPGHAENDVARVASLPAGTEQEIALVPGTPAATEQATAVVPGTPAATEQGTAVVAGTRAATEQEVPVAADRHPDVADIDEETKENSTNGLDRFDRDDFLDVMRTENLFAPVVLDDANITNEYFSTSGDSDDDDESVFDEIESDQEVYADEVESDPEFDDENDLFQQDDGAMRALDWELYDQDYCADLSLDSADFYTGRWGITKSAAAFAESPLEMLYYFLPKTLWRKFASESEAYRIACIPVIAEKIRDRQLAAQEKDHTKTVEDLMDIVDRLEREKPIREHEILHVIGLLVARTLCGHTDGLAKHWAVSEDGAVPRGTFGRYMKRERFRTITRFLHFTGASAEARTNDKAYKIHPVLQAIEKTFRRGYRLGPRVSFDEGTIPNRSQYNPIRVYNTEKPHKYGTKCYMTCCVVTGYCARFVIYSVFDRIQYSVLAPILATLLYLGAEPDKRQLARRQRRDHDASGPELLRTAGAQSNSRGEEQGAAERWADRGGLGGDDSRNGDDDWNDGRLAGDHREGDDDDPSFGDDYQRGRACATGSIIVARDGSRRGTCVTCRVPSRQSRWRRCKTTSVGSERCVERMSMVSRMIHSCGRGVP